MALNANAVWEVRTTGSDNNGGAFRTGASGVDFSQQNSAQATLSAASVVNAVTTQIDVSVGDYTVTNDDVGNHLNITGGTATAGVYEITAVDIPNNRWTVDRSAGTVGQTVVGAMGGAFASLGRAGQFSIASNKIYIKSGTYTITSASNNVANGCISKGVDTYIEGYDTTRGDLGNRPLIQADGVITAFTLIALNATANSHNAINLILDVNNRTTSTGLSITDGVVYKIEVRNATSAGIIETSARTIAIDCLVTGCTTLPFNLEGSAYGCVSRNNTTSGFTLPGPGSTAVRCISYNNTGGSSHGFNITDFGVVVSNCVAYNNGGSGFNQTFDSAIFVNCIAEDNAAFGFNLAANLGIILLNCAGFSNASGEVTSSGLFVNNYDFVTGSSTFFVDAANGDFGLNNNAGGGASARAAGFPGVFPNGTTTGYIDIGAAQHQDSGGGATSSNVIRRQTIIPYRTTFRS